MKSIDERFTIVKLLYVRGPGSFMGLKLSYLFCKSFAFARDIPFLAADSFALSGGKPIFSRNGRRFVKKGETIEIESFDAPFAEALLPPKKLDARMFDKQTLPDYILSAA
jgi:tRNA A37 threonylcarbamoyladenosine modification protein TsaB